MNHQALENQKFSEKALKGFLLKNVDPTTKDPAIQELNNYLVERVDTFWDTVVTPLSANGRFDGNKINWYFEIYKEGLEAQKLHSHPFTFINITQEQIDQLIKLFEGRTLREYLELGTSFLSNSYTLLSASLRDQLILTRLKHIYNSDHPVDWICQAEEEEEGIMKQTGENSEELISILNNISLIISRRV